jgi:hypothetical protein
LVACRLPADDYSVDSSGLGRRVLQTTLASSNWEGELFRNVPECPALAAIMHDAPSSMSRLGNFTYIPTRNILQQCSDMYAITLQTGGMLDEVGSCKSVLLISLQSSICLHRCLGFCAVTYHLLAVCEQSCLRLSKLFPFVRSDHRSVAIELW